MPTRMIREGLLESDKFNSASYETQNFFVRLLLCADDFGRFDGRVTVIRCRMFALDLDYATEEKIKGWLEECAKLGLILYYLVDDKPYLEIPKFNQRLRAKNSKYPEPNGNLITSADIVPTDDGHLHATLQEEKRKRSNVANEIDGQMPVKINNVKKTVVEFSDQSHEIRISKYLFKFLKERNPDYKEPNFQKWASDVDKIIRIDKKDPKLIGKVIEWCQKDDFWKNNILSPAKLRKQFDQLVLKGKLIAGEEKGADGLTPSQRKKKEEEYNRKHDEMMADYYGSPVR